MAIELIIKIPEIEYEHITNKEKFCSLEKSKREWLINKTLNRLLTGIPLPKGHGRLGDLDALNNGLREQQRSYEHIFGIRQPINEAVKDGIIIARTHIDHAPTIIEADKAESDERAKIDCSKTKCENCTNHNYCDYELNRRQESEDKK